MEKLTEKEINIILRALETVFEWDFWDDGEYDFDEEVVPTLNKVTNILLEDKE